MQLIFCVAPRCPRGSLVPYQNEENQFHPVLASLGAGAPMVQSIFCVAPRCPRGSLVPYKSEENQFHPTGCPDVYKWRNGTELEKRFLCTCVELNPAVSCRPASLNGIEPVCRNMDSQMLLMQKTLMPE